ncbi:hypothetical protein AB0B25_20860 [Nocardia sp. NPDC049190]|uniref:hypothetical protein n=1 Tax=Nocardia sp. NPDC049190 TaxID=3155650 RepID=UPI0033FBA794
MLGQPLGVFNHPASGADWSNAGTRSGKGGPEGQYAEVIPLERYRSGYDTGPYGQFGGPPPVPEMAPHPGIAPNGGSSGRGKTLLVVGGGLAVLLVVVAAVTAVALTTRKSDDSAQRNAPSMVSALTTTAGSQSAAPTTSKSTPTTTAKTGNESPLIPGYQAVVAPDRGAAYDVPADWTIAPRGTVGGFGEPPNAVVGKGYASEGKGYCPGSTRTVAFLTGSNSNDSATAATELGTKTATLAYKNTPGTPSAPVPLASLDGSQHGMFVETKGTVAHAKPGCATTYTIYTVAFPSENGNFVMVIAADTGVPHALDAETAKRIFASIRPIGG